MKLRIGYLTFGFLSLALSLGQLAAAQSSTQTESALPRLVRFSGTAKNLNDNPQAGVVGITFALYAEQTGGAPLWLETQNVTVDGSGHYSVLLGSTKPNGLPAELFASEQARWVGVQVSGQAEQPRALLVSAPYALKAGDAETIGGLPPSAFVLAAPVSGGGAGPISDSATDATSGSPTPRVSDVTTTGGTVNAIPLFSAATSIQNSILTQTAATTVNVGGKLSLPATAAASKTAGANSRPLDFVASSFSSSSSTAVNQTFQWQAEPAANDTASPSGTLNLLYGLGTAAPSETGLKLSSKGIFTFATGQTFTGNGAGLTNLQGASVQGVVANAANATDLGGLAPSAYAKLSTADTFTGSVNMVSDTRIDFNGLNKGSYTPAIRFGTGNTGEAISSDRAGTVNVNGIDLYTNFTPRLSVTNAGSVGIGTTTPVSRLDVLGTGNFSSSAGNAVIGTSTAQAAFAGVSGSGPYGVYGQSNIPCWLANNVCVPGAGGYFLGSGGVGNGTPGVVATGGNAGPVSAFGSYNGGDGVDGYGGIANGGTSGVGVAGYGAAASDVSQGQAGVLGMGGLGDAPGFSAGSGGVFQGGSTGAVNPGYGDGIDATAGSGYAGNFTGDLNVSGAITAGTKDFKIDHPLDPANKYLVHASVESSEMMNIYTGNVTTDAQGHATVPLPEWFEVLNSDFRYQLTVIGQFSQAIVSHEIENHRFEISTSAPNVKVSWQVTGVRQDAYAKAHPLVIEQEKDARLRGFYIHPELYGAPPEKQIEWARHPQMMKRLKAPIAKQQLAIRVAPTARALSK